MFADDGNPYQHVFFHICNARFCFVSSRCTFISFHPWHRFVKTHSHPGECMKLLRRIGDTNVIISETVPNRPFFCRLCLQCFSNRTLQTHLETHLGSQDRTAQTEPSDHQRSVHVQTESYWCHLYMFFFSKPKNGRVIISPAVFSPIFFRIS